MSSRAPSSPSTGYSIVDIRTPSVSDLKCKIKTDVARPPSPPHSSETSEDAFNASDLSETIIDSLDKPLNQKSIPTYILYDKKGLQLFDQITYLDEYYLTNAELDILKRKSDEFAQRLQHGSVIFELGAGALRKTEVVLNAIEKRGIHVSYYALDLDQHELEKSLASLGEFEYVRLYGLLGTYDQGIPWISQEFALKGIQKNFMWLGSSIGNMDRLQSAVFLAKLQRMCVEPGDLCLVGFDKRNDPEKIRKAYDDSQGVTREFIMSGLDHVNLIMGQEDFIDRRQFAYDSVYQEKQGRHIAHYRALVDTQISYQDRNIKIQKDELIHVEHSYKYSLEETDSILSAAGLTMVERWTDTQDLYSLVLAESRPFQFERNMVDVLKTLFPSEEVNRSESVNCDYCTVYSNVSSSDLEAERFDFAQQRGLGWPTESLPTTQEWRELWSCWDLVTQHMIHHPTMLFERPIALRHPFIFYLGHIPGFLDIQLSRHQVDKEIGCTKLTEPAYFSEMFERGIDPDMEDPSKCHAHSEVPAQDCDWPSIESMMLYQKNIRERLMRLLNFWESEALAVQNTSWIDSNPERKRQARIVWMCFEHEAMHLETLLYMLMQSPNIRAPKVSPPSWKLNSSPEEVRPLSDAPILNVPAAGTVILGCDDSEASDFDTSSKKIQPFGWDNESPPRVIKDVQSFKIQARTVTNGEYLAYIQNSNLATMPVSWLKENGLIYVRTVFGLCPMQAAQHWPVQVSYNEASAYAQAKGGRLPTEVELVQFREFVSNSNLPKKLPNIGFKDWTPTAVNNKEIQYLGDHWEWTDSLWDTYAGFKTSTIYPGYSVDFFDQKHRVVLGGSWATHPRIAERKTFRNWYQSGYPYVFSGFRLCF
ncbi:hypothetical protein BY458DRAFT_475596 [Sporodiniella umbellata]|nr:hypothetical protein BY458DRAFT_475596 [Sporodiniella umbellata]